jgi:hypothetical protein
MPRQPVWIEGGQKAPGQPETKPPLCHHHLRKILAVAT